MEAGLKPPFCGLVIAGAGLAVEGGGRAGREACCGGFAGRPGGGGYDMMNSWPCQDIAGVNNVPMIRPPSANVHTLDGTLTCFGKDRSFANDVV